MRWCKEALESMIAYALFALIVIVAWTTLQRMFHVWTDPQEQQVMAAAPQSPSLFIGRTPKEAELDAKLSQTPSRTANDFDEGAATLGHTLQVEANHTLRTDLSALFAGWAKSLSSEGN